jgi:hypothetical protein
MRSAQRVEVANMGRAIQRLLRVPDTQGSNGSLLGKGEAMETRQWKVTAYTGKNRNVLLGSSYVLADSESEAIDLGKQALRLIGVRGTFRVSATRYSPLRDLAFQGFVRAV